MPSSKHLEWADIADFTPGYFSVGDWLMPANGSQEMVDCRPDLGGGLRAAMKPTVFSTSGLASGKVAGIYTHIMPSPTWGAASDRYIAIATGTQTKIYRWNDTLATRPTSWTLIATTDGDNGNMVFFDTFIDSGGFTHVVWTIGQATATTDNGLYGLQFSYQAGQGVSAIDDTGATAVRSVIQHYTGYVTTLAVQDDIIIIATPSIHAYILRWCASQDLTSWPAANNLPVQASRDGSSICSITPFAPGDLLIGTGESAWTMVQGGIADPVVRTMSAEQTLTTTQKVVQTPAGLAFVAEHGGVYATGDGNSFEELSEQIDPQTWPGSQSGFGAIGPGSVTFGGSYLLAPHGLFFDFRTKGWHRSSVLVPSAKDHFIAHYDKFNHEFFVAAGTSSPSLYLFGTNEDSRCSTFTWKSASFHHPSGRQIRMREVQIFCKTYDTGSSIAVTINGTTKTVSPTTAGRQQLDFLFDEANEVLDVQVVSTAASTGEAPSIEVVRVGTLSQHRLK